MRELNVTVTMKVRLTGAWEKASPERVRAEVNHQLDSWEPRPGIEFRDPNTWYVEPETKEENA